MYYLAFFVDYLPFFQTKIKTWSHNCKTNTCILIDKDEYHTQVNSQILFQYKNSSYIKYIGLYQEQNWYIFGEYLNKRKISPFPSLFITKSSQFSCLSLEKVDTIIKWFANNYNWSILPWSNSPRFLSFVFISVDKKMRDRFINCTPNTWNLTLEDLNDEQYFMSEGTLKCNFLINKYDVSDNFSENIKAILFEENKNTVGEIWDACSCDTYTPYLVSNIRLENFPLLHDMLHKDQIVKMLHFFEDNFAWHIYEIQKDKKFIFELISSYLISALRNIGTSKNRFYWVSQNTDWNKLKNLLIKTENIDSNYSDLSYLQDYLDASDWLYGCGRDLGISDEYFLSLFVSKNSQIIQEIDIFRQEKKITDNDLSLLDLNSYYNLLGCF